MDAQFKKNFIKAMAFCEWDKRRVIEIRKEEREEQKRRAEFLALRNK